MRAVRAILVTALLPITFLRLAWGHPTAPFIEFPITSDFGPRFLTADNRFDFHKAIDWSRAAGLSIPLLEAGSVIRLSYSTLANPLSPQAGGILIFETVGEHRFRYLHMFNNTALPIDSGDFTLALTANNRLAIIRWANRTSLTAAYAIAEESGDIIQLPAGLVLNQDGSSPIETINTLTTTNNASIGPSGGSGGFAPHMHVDHGIVQIGGQTVAASENPLAHVGQAASGFTITFLDRNGVQRQEGSIVRPGNADDAFIKIRADTTNGKNLDRVEFLVDGQVGIGNQIRDFQFGGITAEHDPLNTDVELDPGARSNGLTDGVVTAGALGIEDFVYNGWDTAATPSVLRPGNLEDGEHALYACLTNIRSQRFCKSVSFITQKKPILLIDGNGKELTTTASPPDQTNADWISTSTLKFSLVDEDGIARFDILHGPGPVFELVFTTQTPAGPLPAPTYAAITPDGPPIDDSRDYYIARLTDVNENVEQAYFLLDRRGPRGNLDTVTVNLRAETMTIAGSVSDEASGAATAAVDPEGQEPAGYTGPVYPPGQASQTVFASKPPGNYAVQGRDLSGKSAGPAFLQYAVDEGVHYGGLTQSRGNAGHILKAVGVNVAGYVVTQDALVATQDSDYLTFPIYPGGVPPDVGRVRVSVRSSPIPSPADFTLNGHPSTLDTVVLTSDGAIGPFSETTDVELAADITAEIALLTNQTAAEGLLRTTGPDGTFQFSTITIRAGSITPVVGDVDPDPNRSEQVALTLRSAKVVGIDGISMGYKPVSQGVNTSILIPPISIFIPNLTGRGVVGAGPVSMPSPVGFAPSSKIYDVAITAQFFGKLRLGMKHDGIFDFPAELLEAASGKTRMWQNHNGVWKDITSSYQQDGIEGETAENSLFMLAIKDGIPPISSATFLGASFESPDGLTIVSTRTTTLLTARDPAVGDDVETGVRASYYSTTGVFLSTSQAGVSTFETPFSLEEGLVGLAYASEDYVHNVEAATLTVVAVDGTPPTSSLSITGPMVVESSRVIVGPQTLFSLSAADPLSNGVSAGTAAVAALLDETVESCGLSLEEEPVIVPGAPPGSCGNPLYSEPFAVPAGTHTLAHFALDNVLNVGVLKSTVVVGDYAAPSAVFQDVPLYTRNPLPPLRAVFSDTLAGVDVSSLSLTLDGTPVPANVVGTGDLGAWQTGPSLSLPLHAFEVVHLNGWLYSLGGHAGTFQTPRVLLSRLVDGAPQPWADTAPLPRILAAHSAAVLGGRIYTVGGTVAGDGALNSVFYTDPDDATGLISSWQTGPSLPSSLGFLDAVGLGVANRRLYAVGGRDGGGSPRNTVNFSPIDAQTGAPGAWSAATSLPVPLAFSDAVEWNGRIYVAGGLAGPAATDATDRILSIGSDSNGQLVGSWRDERVMPNPVYSLEVAVLQSRLYVMGGFDRQNVKQSAVHSAAIAADGTLGPWRAEAPLHRPMGFFGSAATTGALYYAGGDTSTGISADVRWNPLGVGDLSSVLVTAVPAAPLTERTYTLAALGADRVANAGSTSRTLTVDFTAPTVTLNAGGRALTQGAAQLVAGAAPQLAAAFSDVTSGIDQASIVLLLDGADVTSLAQVALNGNDAQAAYTPTALAPGIHTLEARAADRAGNATTLTAQFRLDPAPPEVALSSPTSGALFGAGPIALHADFADSLSGLATGTLTLTVDGSTLPATISFDAGGPSGWQTAPSLSLALHAFEVVHLNGWLYSLGGHAGAFQTPRVLLSQLVDGVPQGWNDTTALPSILAAHSAAVLGGRIYTLGGSIVGAPALNTVYYADPDDTSGLIANWNTGASLPSSLGFLDAVGLGVANRHLYAVGGRDGGGSPHNTVFFSPINLQTGAPGAWNQTTALPVPLAFSDAVEWNGRIYVAGGLVGPAATDATDRILSIASDANGLLVDSWRDERLMPLPVYGLEVAVLQGRLYVMGGFDRQNVKQSAVHSAAIAPDGTLGPWRAEAPLHRPMTFFGSAATSGALYYAGGDTSTGISADVRYMKAGGQVLVAHASATAEGITEGGPHVARASGSDLAGNVAVASAAFYVDLTGPETSLIVQGASVTAPGLVLTPIASTFALTARDLPATNNAGVAATYLAVNGAPPQLAPASLPLGTGTSLLEFWSVDALGNVGSTQTLLVTIQAAESVAAAVDGTAGISAPQPVAISTLALAAAPGVFQLAADLQGLSPVFPVYYELTGGTFPPGEPALLSFYIDLSVVPDTATLRIFTFNGTEWVDEPILNQTFTLLSENFGVFTGELEHTSPYALMRRTIPSDTVSPAVAFAFPRTDEPGLCRLAQGPVAVRGSASDENLSAWSLTQASLLLGSGTANVQGTLGIWDATGLSGSYTIALSAQDAVGNTATSSLAVQAGSPARTLALGGKQVLSKPRGVAAGPNRVYVADTNADRVRVFDAAGVPLAVLGDRKGAAKLNKPAGLALDSAGNILVADANNKRVVKLSPAGAFLAEYGKGVLKRPMAVAVSLGRIVAADAKTGQIVVFADAGSLLARVDVPGVPARQEDDDEEDAPRPMALAADAAGNVWAADAKGGRVLRYTPGLALAQTIPGFRRPEGVAVSPSGACLAVSDAKDSRIRTFDAALSAGMAAFGVHGEIKENRTLPTEFFLNKPAQLAFDAQGTLLVADRNNDLIQGFGLPGAPLVVAMGTPGRSGGGNRLSSAGDDEIVASARVGRLEGGRVEHPDGAAVEVPAGAINTDLDVAVAKAADSGDEHRVREAARGSAGLAAASVAREFSPHGLEFREPAVITLPYDPLLAAAPRELKIHYWNGERGAWEALASTVDEGARTVSARVAHFSVYQVLAPVSAIGTLADPDTGFAFRAIYAFPNPAVGGQRPTVHVAVGRADKVVVRFYDVAGTPVHEATLDTPSVVNDESGPHLAYEHVWTGHIPSGVYLYAVTAEKAGHAPIKRVGKLAVVR